MIIHKSTKSIEILNGFPNENFGNYENVFVVDDTNELAQKIKENTPYLEFVLDVEENLIDITPTEKPTPPPLQPSPIEQLQSQITQSNEIQSQVVLALVMGGLM